LARPQILRGTLPGKSEVAVEEVGKIATEELRSERLKNGPLMELSESFGAAIRAGGRVLLSGLLVEQADMVVSTYTRRGFVLERHIDLETGGAEWRTLVLRKP